MDKSFYYDLNKLLSFNRILNFVIGARGVGKTYGSKKHSINRFIKYGEQFIYLKRYKSDIKGTNEFFDAVAKEFPNHTFKVRGHDLLIDGLQAGWVMALSSWQSIKSREFPDVKTIIYDEFLLESSSKQHYMDNEPEALLNFMDTVIRNRDDAKVICMSNAVSIVNPYFIYFKLYPNKAKRFNKYENIIVEIPDSYDFAEERKKTRFGQLIAETDYGDFSLGNEFKDDSQVFIERRTPHSKYKFTIVYDDFYLGLWVDVKDTIMYLSQDHDPSSKHKYALTKDDVNEDVMLVFQWKANYHLFKMISAFKRGLLRFENQTVRNKAYDMFKFMNIK